MSRRTIALAAALVLAVGLSCKDSGGPVAGTLRVRLTMPAGNSGADGAILFTLAGPATPANVAPGTGLRVFHEPLSGTTKVAVTGTLTANAVLMTFDVNDVRQGYQATIQQVAAAGYGLRPSLAGYSLQVTR